MPRVHSKEEMLVGKLRLPLWIAGLLSFLYGLISLSPALASSVFAYDVKDLGLLALVAGLFISLGIVTVAVASNTEKYGGLASAFVLVQLVAIVILLWKWLAGVFTARNALASLIIAIVLAVWIWRARPKS